MEGRGLNDELQGDVFADKLAWRPTIYGMWDRAVRRLWRRQLCGRGLRAVGAGGRTRCRRTA